MKELLDLDLTELIWRVQNWLVRSPIQITDGIHEGGIVSWLDGMEQPSSIYGEITGYYLTCSHFMIGYSGISATLERRMERAEDWLNRVWRTPSPLTRYYLTEGVDDWRNRVTFSFDLAMMLRGLSFGDREKNRDTSRAIVQELGRLVAVDGTLSPYRYREDDRPLPVKWSTCPGPFQVKTAASILLARDVPETLQIAARATVDRYREHYLEHPLSGGLHQLFYHLEGLFLLGSETGDRSYGERVAQVYRQLMERQSPDGSLPSSIEEDAAPIRADILAQALRIGCLLVQMNYLTQSLWCDRLHRLAESLTRHIHPLGAVCFHEPDGELPRHWNVWCTMFTYQALCFYEAIANDRPVDKLWQKLLV